MRTIPLALLVAAACAVSSCSGEADAVAVEDFAEGTCRTAAPDVIAIGDVARDLGDGPEVERGQLAALRDAQDRLAAVAEGAEAALKPALTDLVTAVGVVRIRADGRTFEPSLREQLVRSYDAVLQACTP